MNDTLTRVVATREDAHRAVTQGYALAKAIIDNGRPAQIDVREFDDDRTLRQNRYYWGVVLKEVSQQASIGGQRWSVDAWHELFKRQFLGYEVVKVKVAGKRRPVVIRRLRSTTDLKVRPFATYLTEIQAFAATDLGVQFSTLDWEGYEG